MPYRYLWRTHFPGLRASEVFVYATVEPPIIESEISAPSDPSDLSDLSDKSDMSDQSDNPALPALPLRRGYRFALKTNALFDLGGLLPNIGVEFPVGEHLSLGANWMYAWWKNHDRNRHWRIYGGDIDARWYFARHDGRPLTGHHLGVYGQVLLFQIAFGGKGYITGIPGENLWGKPYLGGGVEYGYSKQIAKRFNIDFSLGLGYMAGEYRTYRPIDGHYVWQSTHRRNWFGPTKAEISLVWLIGSMKGGER